MFVSIPFADGRFMVNEYGVVINSMTGHVLAQPIGTHGYNYVTLQAGRKNRAKFLVHRLVAQAFLPNPNNLPVVMHKDNNKQNNRLDNLKWGTHLENLLQAIQDGLNKGPIHKYRIWNPFSPVYIECEGLDALAKRIHYSSRASVCNIVNKPHFLFKGPFAGWYIRKVDDQRSSDDVGGIYPLM